MISQQIIKRRDSFFHERPNLVPLIEITWERLLIKFEYLIREMGYFDNVRVLQRGHNLNLSHRLIPLV